MDQEQDQIRQDIEATRTSLGDTVEAIAYKTDVKARAREAVAEKRDQIASRLQPISSKAAPLKDNPFALAGVSVAAGFLAGIVRR